MKEIVRNISNKKNLKKNLPLYADKMAEAYNRYSLIELSMNYYIYFEMLRDIAKEKKADIKHITNEVNKVIKSSIIDGQDDREESVKVIDNIRNDIIRQTEILTAYTDIFSIYEYVLNRVEYNFTDTDVLCNYSDEQFCREIMQYIFDTDDHFVISSKIQEIIQQLPIRLTKAKFYSMLEEALSVYKDSSTGGLDDFIYMIRSSAMLDIPEGFEDSFRDLREVYSDLQNIDFKEIDSQGYTNAVNKLNFVTDYLQRLMDEYIMLEELVNDIYIFILTAPLCGVNSDERNTCREIISSVNKDFECDSDEATDIDDLFISLEGRQEDLYEIITGRNITKDIIENYGELLDDLELNDIYGALDTIEKLSSDSLFIELNTEYDVHTADKDYIDQCFLKLKEEFGYLFEKNGKYINRAVIAVVISKFPVFFNNVTELQDYVYNALSNCRNNAEKKACVEIISQIIGEN